MDPAILSFDEFLATQSYHLPVGDFLINLIIAGILAFLLSYTYINYGTALSNRKMFARNFVLMAMTTMFIITVVKSSLALSLGLVGALSIVRFRTAIKEPEELKKEWDFTGKVVDHGPIKDQKPIKRCQLCGHNLRYGYILINSKNNKKVEVGSECIGNYMEITPSLQGKIEYKKQNLIKKAKKAKSDAAKEEKYKIRHAASWASVEIDYLIKAVDKTRNYDDMAAIQNARNNDSTMYKYIKSGIVEKFAKKYKVKINMDRINKFMSLYKP